MNNVGERIKQILKKQNISQAKLCELTNIKAPAMSKYLNGDASPRTEIIVKISDALNVSLYTLLGKQEEKDAYFICKNALMARSGNKLTDEEKKELITLILGD